MNFNTEHSTVPTEDMETYSVELEGEIEAMNAATHTEYSDPRASINLPVDTPMHEHVKDVAQKYRCDTLIVVGIGGSNLGTIAVHEAINTTIHNSTGDTTVYFADTVDPRRLEQLGTVIREEKEADNRVVINAISKSGGTTETIANFEYLSTELDSDEDVVITTTEGSAFDTYAQKHDIQTLYIPPKVGGRYSVLSPVGLFPLAVLDVDTDALVKGAREACEHGLQPFESNPSAQSAAILYHHYMHNRNVANTFLFSPDLESIGKWYRQLMGESIGKEYNADGTKQVYVGMTPTVSIGSTDLHSMAQLYLGGPDDKYHMFITVEQNGAVLPQKPEFNNLVEDIQGRPFNELMTAILDGVRGAFKKQERPFTSIELEHIDEYSIGWLLQMKMMEMMYLSSMLDVNPFDQPNVESYKVITKKLLQR